MKRLPSKESHSGRAPPSDVPAISVRSSPSLSIKVSIGRTKSTSISSSKFWSDRDSARTGASLIAFTVRTKLSETLNSPSLAVTVMSRVPLKSAGGVPVKRLPSKDNQSTSGSPLDIIAVNISASPSISENALIGSVKSTNASSSKL